MASSTMLVTTGVTMFPAINSFPAVAAPCSSAKTSSSSPFSARSSFLGSFPVAADRMAFVRKSATSVAPRASCGNAGKGPGGRAGGKAGLQGWEATVAQRQAEWMRMRQMVQKPSPSRPSAARSSMETPWATAFDCSPAGMLAMGAWGAQQRGRQCAPSPLVIGINQMLQELSQQLPSNNLQSGYLSSGAKWELQNTDQAWLLQIEVPGFDASDVKVQVEGLDGKGSVLHISGDRRKVESADSGAREAEGSASSTPVYARRSQKSHIQARFPIPDTIRADAISANVSRGILLVTLPKLTPVEKKNSIRDISVGDDMNGSRSQGVDDGGMDAAQGSTTVTPFVNQQSGGVSEEVGKEEGNKDSTSPPQAAEENDE